MTERRLEVLFFDGCPNADLAASRARDAIEAAAVAVPVILVRVLDEDDARRLRFLGSPTVRVDGEDVDPVAATRDDFGMQCRIYRVGDRVEGAPPVEWIATALLRCGVLAR
jgi:hypothetical protein